MCNCIEDTQLRVKENLSKKNEDYNNKTITKVVIENTALMFDCKQSTQAYSPVKIEYDIVNKKGDTVHKKEVANFTYSYCPFCGEKYE